MLRAWLSLHLFLLLSLPALFVGSVHVVAQAAVGGLACLFALLMTIRLASRSGDEFQVRLDGFFWLLLIFFFLTLFQLLPLPVPLLRWLSPQADEVYRQILGGIGLYNDSSWVSLSLAPPETAGKVIRDIGVLALYIAVLQWARTRWHLEQIMRFSIYGALGIGALVVLQTALRLQHPLLGLYRIDFPVDSFLYGAPLINPNHFGGYLLFHALLSMTLTFEAEEGKEQFLWGLASIFLGTLVFLTVSRGAALGFLLGAVAVLWALAKKIQRRFARRKDKKSSSTSSDDDEEEERLLFTSPVPHSSGASAATPVPPSSAAAASATPVPPSAAAASATPVPHSSGASAATPVPLSAEASARAASATPIPPSSSSSSSSSKNKTRGPSGDHDEAGALLRRWAKLWEQPAIRGLMIVFILGLGVIVNLSASTFLDEIQKTRFSLKEDKLSMISEFSWPLIKAYPALGVGRGAMPMAWHRFSSQAEITQGRYTATHAESIFVQPLIDWGVFFGVTFLLGLGWLLWSVLRKLRSFLEQGAAIALCALLLQNFADFNLEFPATAFPWFAILAALIRLRLEERRKFAQAPPPSSVIWPAAIGICGIFLVAGLTPYAWSHQYRKIPSLWSAVSKAPAEEFPARLHSLLRHHPSDYLLTLHLAEHYSLGRRWQPQDAILWLDRAAFLNPTAGEVYILRGYVYARLGLFESATHDLSLAVKHTPSLLRSCAYVAEKFKLHDPVVRLSPSSKLVALSIQELTQDALHVEETYRLAKIALKRFNDAERIYRMVASFYVTRLQNIASTEAEYKVWEKRLFRLLETMQRRLPDTVYFSYLLRGHLLMLEQKYKEAKSFYTQAMSGPLRGSRNIDRWSGFLAKLRAMLRLQEFEEAHELIRSLKKEYENESSYHQAELSFQEGQTWRARYEYRKALAAYEDAVQLFPQRGYWLSIGEVCTEIGLYERSLRIYRQLDREKPTEGLKKRIEDVIERQKRSSTHHETTKPRE